MYSVDRYSKGHRDSRDAGFPGYTLTCVAIALLTPFAMGFNIGVGNAPERTIRACEGVDVTKSYGGFPGCIPMEEWVWGVTTGMFAAGGLIGGLSTSFLMDRIGRRWTLIVSALIGIIGGALMATSTMTALLIVGRLVVGVSCGIGSTTAPVYISEVATIKYRGFFGSLVQVSVVISILLAQILGVFFSTPLGWRFLFGATALAPALQVFLLLFATETPAYLVAKGQFMAAGEALARLRAGFDSQPELDMLMSAGSGRDRKMSEKNYGDGPAGSGRGREMSEKNYGDGPAVYSEAPMGIFQLLRSSMLKVVFIGLTIHGLQQLTGINSVFFYSTSMFTDAFGANTARWVTVGIGAINVAMTFVSSVLIERAGRKSLLLWSIIGMTLSSGIVVIGSIIEQNIVVISAVFLFVASFAIGLGPVPWLIMPELFPTKAVGAASSLALGVNWLSNCLISFLFPVINQHLKAYSFMVFVITGILGTMFLWFMLVDTKGKTPEQVQRELLGSRANRT